VGDGRGIPALLLHGGPTSDNTDSLVPFLPDSLRAIRLIHGVDDPLPHSASTATARLVPHATVETIDGAGHLPWLEQPEAFRAAVERVLSQ
jgi:pimeloyl-ACP methyl ester carboxylesterase